MSLGCAHVGHGSPAHVLLVGPRPRSLSRDLPILHMPLIIPLPLFVLSQKKKLLDGGMALAYSHASFI
jgi:hypothetical protein